MCKQNITLLLCKITTYSHFLGSSYMVAIGTRLDFDGTKLIKNARFYGTKDDSVRNSLDWDQLRTLLPLGEELVPTGYIR